MNYTEMVEDFVTLGSLPAEQEHALFSALAADEELRAEFKMSLAMRSAVRNDRAAFVPPPSSVNAVFARLGYSAPIGAAAGAGLAMRLREVFSGSNLAAAAVGALLMGLASLGFNAVGAADDAPPLADGHSVLLPGNHAKASLAANAAAEMAQNDGLTAANAPSRSADNVESFDDAPAVGPSQDAQTSGSAASTSAAADVTSAIPVEEVVAEQSASTAEFASAEKLPVSERLAAADLRNVNLSTGNASRAAIGRQELQTVSILSSLEEAASDLKMDATYRLLAMRPLQQSDLPSTANAGPNNFAVGLNIDLGSDFLFVFEVGREEFFLDFERRTPDDLWLITERRRGNILWGTMGMRYSPVDEGLFQPFAQLGLGGAAIGALGRAQLGFEGDLSSNVAFSLGLETSFLAFPVDGAWFNSQNIGLTYGFSYKF